MRKESVKVSWRWKPILEFRKIKLEDEKTYREFEATMLDDKKSNPFVEW